MANFAATAIPGMSSNATPSMSNPLEVPPISVLPPITPVVLGFDFIGTSSKPTQQYAPSEAEILKEKSESARMLEKVAEAEEKRVAAKASKALKREGERGQWWPCDLKDSELKELEKERFLKEGERTVVDQYDNLRVSDNKLTTNTLSKRIRTIYMVKKEVDTHQMGSDIYTKGEHPLLCSLQGEDSALFLRHPLEYPHKEDQNMETEDEDKEDDPEPERYTSEPTKRARGVEAEGSAKKAKKMHVRNQRRHDSKPHEHARITQIKAPLKSATITLPKSSDRQKTYAVKDNIKPKGKALGSKTKVSPTTVPKNRTTPTKSAPTSVATTSAPKSAPSKDIIQVESGEESHSGDHGDGGAGFGQDNMEDESENMAEATTDDAKVTVKKSEAPEPSDKPKFDTMKYDFLARVKTELNTFLYSHLHTRKDTQHLHEDMHSTIKCQKCKMEEMAQSETQKDKLIAMLRQELEQSIAESSKAELNKVFAKLSVLEAEHETLKENLEKNHRSHTLVENQLKSRIAQFEKTLLEKDELIKKHETSIQKLKADVAREQALSKLAKSEVFDPLGYIKEITEPCPQKDLYKLSGRTIRDLLTSCRKICKVMTIKDGQTCDAEALAGKMEQVSAFIEEWQKSSARGAGQIAQTMVLARNPKLDLDLMTKSVPDGVNKLELLQACEGYDQRITGTMNHSGWYDFAVLKKDVEAAKKATEEAEAEVSGSSNDDEAKIGFPGSSSGKDDESKNNEDIASSPTNKAEECSAAP